VGFWFSIKENSRSIPLWVRRVAGEYVEVGIKKNIKNICKEKIFKYTVYVYTWDTTSRRKKTPDWYAILGSV
jgi:hypothetical protein